MLTWGEVLGLEVDHEHDARQRPMIAERLGAELARTASESLPVVESRGGIEQPLRPGAIRIELGAHVGAEFEQNLVGVVRRRDAIPRAGAQGGEPLGPAGWFTHGE